MNNEVNSNNSKNSSLPLIIIGLVLVVAIIGGWWLYNNSQTPSAKNNNTNSNGKTAQSAADKYNKASPGANPPNYLGSPNAAVTVEEFADFQCPTCAFMHPKIQEIRAAYGDRIRIVFREFPLEIAAHDKAYAAAVAAEAAGLQGKFWDMQNLLFSNQKSWERDPNYREIFQSYAQKIGLDVEKFNNDMMGVMAKDRVDKDKQRGRSLGVGGTPTIYINGRMLEQTEMTSEGMRQIIDAELQKAGK